MSEAEPMRWMFKIIDRDAWAAWPDRGTWPGTAKDLEDGFVHLSGADQVRGTLAKHYAGRVDCCSCGSPSTRSRPPPCAGSPLAAAPCSLTATPR
jgi:hypothetical protein